MGERDSKKENQTRLTEERAKNVKVEAGVACLGVSLFFFSWLHLRKATLTALLT